MARRSSGGSITQPPEPRKRRKLTFGRILGTTLVLVLVLAGLFYGAGGWYYSSKIENDAFTVEHDPPTYNLTAETVGAEEVTLVGSDTNLDQDAVFGLDWPEGYANVGPPLISQDGPENTGDEVARSYTAGANPLAAGTEVRLDPFYYDGDPTSEFGYPFVEVTFESNVGPLGAWYVRGSKPIWMIMVHGKGAERQEALRLVPLAWERGYHVMVIDYRNDEGRGEDPSGRYQWGTTEWEDVAAAARYARENGAEQTVLVGYSMGGAAVLNFLAYSPLRNFTIGAILDSPVSDLEATIDYNAGQTKIGPITLPASLTGWAKILASWRFDIEWDDYDSTQLWREWAAPMLVIHGTGDLSVPVETSEALRSLRPDLVELVTPQDVGHVLAWNADQEAYEADVNAFLDRIETGAG